MVEYYSERPVFSVSELSRLLDAELSEAFPDIWIRGEVSNFSSSPAGHLYFRLKDGEAVMKTAMFKTAALRLPFRIENGMELLVRGRLGYYGNKGDLQIYASHAEPYGVGAMQMALEQARKRLQDDGLTDPARKRALPPYPRKIGIVTSADGAALADILSILARRGAPFEVVVSVSSVQGEQAPGQLKAAMERLFRAGGIDLIILTRGGGSFEDLNAFNDESLARVVAASPVPVVSAVGHEINTVLTDLTADLRAPTPSAAAEIVSQPFVEAASRVAAASSSALSRMADKLRLAGESLSVFDPWGEGRAFLRQIERLEETRDRTASRLVERMLGRFVSASSKTDLLTGSLHPLKLMLSISVAEEKAASAEKGLFAAVRSALALLEGRLSASASMLEASNPLSILSRGYSVVKNREGAVISESSQVEKGEQLSVLLHRGRLKITVDERE